MRFTLTNNIALGVKNAEEAATFYENVLGYTRGQAKDNWIEVKSGPFQLYLVSDEVQEPTFDFEVEYPEMALTYLEANGFKKVELANTSEIFVRDPYGYLYCLSKKGS